MIVKICMSLDVTKLKMMKEFFVKTVK